MVEYNDPMVAGGMYGSQSGGGVPPINYGEPSNIQTDKKTKTARILGFVAMGLGLISIPMLFLSIVRVSGFLVSANLNIFQLSKIANFFDFFDSAQKIVVFVGIYIGAIILLSLVGAVFDIFKSKGCKIASTIVKAIPMIMSIVAIVLLIVKGEDEINPGIGLYLNAVFLFISFVLSLVATIVMPKKTVATGNGRLEPLIDIPPVPGKDVTALAQGRIIFTSGCCAGYDIPLNPGAKIVIGKDPSQCSIIIDKSYTKVSRTHCSVEYDSLNDVYMVTDMSTNGTKIVGGPKLQRGTPSYLSRGTVINLAGTDNTFRLD